MDKITPSLDVLIKLNPNVDAKQIAELNELMKKLKNIPTGAQKAPSPIMRRRIEFGESDATERRTIRLTMRR